MPTPLTTADRPLAEAAGQLMAAGPVGVALAERICDWVHRHMTYRHDVTSIHTTAAAALALGSGVCQDFAHVALALCRGCGLPARYVSGHLLGEGGSHAWIEVMIPAADASAGIVTVALDPTHNRRTGPTHLTVATGRDYRDVAPTSGTYRASASGVLTIRKQAALGRGRLPDGLTQPRNSWATPSHRSVVSRSDSTSIRSSLPWKRSENCSYVTPGLMSPQP